MSEGQRWAAGVHWPGAWRAGRGQAGIGLPKDSEGNTQGKGTLRAGRWDPDVSHALSEEC